MNNDDDATLIRTPELVDLLRAQPPILIDVRWMLGSSSQHSAYLAGHIPGAHFCDLDTDLANPPGAGGRHPLPDPARLQRRMREWGIDEDSRVVVYDADNSLAAARAWWVLRWAGFTHVRVLDGGFAAWSAAQLPVEAGQAPTAAGTVVVHPGSREALKVDDVLALARDGRLIDVRTPERFSGESEPIDPVPGHIPGALNLPAARSVLPDGTFKSIEALRIEFSAVGLHADSDAPVGVYCGSGVTASQSVLAMHLAGIEATLYPGSWSEWITDPTRPVARED